MTFGERAVGLTFNPSGDNAVAACKSEFARVIDRMNDLRNAASDPEVNRMASVAITEAQTAQMWAVKALTWKAGATSDSAGVTKWPEPPAAQVHTPTPQPAPASAPATKPSWGFDR